jgi:hypothetical protein
VPLLRRERRHLRTVAIKSIVPVRTTDEQVTADDGVNAARTFFMHNLCKFQEVDLRNDIGKDVYVDIATNGVVSYLCVALQIKSGVSYRTAKGDYFIPVGSHAESWRLHTIPVFGIVYDPDDTLMRWVDITGYLRAHPRQEGGTIPVSCDSVLTVTSLAGEFRNAIIPYVGQFGTIALNLLLAGDLQMGALYDAWALGRFDPKYLLIVRRLIMDLQPETLRRAIFFLSHAGSHPNILYNTDKLKGNWIPPEVEEQLLPTFLWSPEEIARMLRAVDYQDWGYHSLGECLDVLFYEDSNIVAKLHIAINLLLKDPDRDTAVRAATIALSHAKDKRKELVLLKLEYPMLMEEEWFQNVSAAVEESGEFSVYF